MNIIAVLLCCMLPSLIYNYNCYKKKEVTKTAFVLINFVAILGSFTIYYASTL